MHISKNKVITIIAICLLVAACALVYFWRQKTNDLAGEYFNDQQIAEYVARMTLPEKIGQMVLVDKNVVSPTDVKQKVIGGVLSGGGGNPKDNTPDNWKKMVEEYQSAALESKLEIPILYGVDAVHGNGNVKEAVIFPHNIGLGAAHNSALVEAIGTITGDEIRATGANWNFAPVLSLPGDLRWGRVYECYGDDAKLVSELGVSYIRGLQKTGVLATPKHFIGEGAEDWNTSKDYNLDQGDISLSEAALEKAYLEPFAAALRAGAMSIMVSRSSLNGEKMSGNRYLLTTLLKEKLGFRGFLVSDWGAVDQISGDYYKDIVTSVNAGMDMVMLPADYDTFISNITSAVSNGDIPQSRIDDAVTRIIRAKASIGLFNGNSKDRTTSDVGSSDHRTVARQAVRESLVLLKNNRALPLKNPKTILIVGRAADDIGMQSGGWTIEWQGGHGETTPGTSILAAFKNEFKESKIIYDPLANQKIKEKADIGIVVVGEQPYAEGKGDREQLTLSLEDEARIVSARRNSKKVILLIIAGRPLIIEKSLQKVDATVMAWLPGSEGEGITDVISGTYNFKGKLPLDWPRTMKQIEAKEKSNPLFNRGFGLSY